MLQAALRRHLNSVSQAVERVCREQQGHSLGEMAAALVNAFLDAKMKDAKTSAALYSVSSDVDGFKISREVNLRANDQIAEMLASARDGLAHDPQIIASMVQATLNGVSRRVLESEEPARGFAEIRNELIFFVTAYLDACSSRAQSSALKNGKS